MRESEGGDAHTAVILNPGNFRLPDGYKPESGHRQHQKSFTSTRTALHRGHRIKIKTTYRIEIDDEPLALHTMVLDNGNVHCHGLPNYSFPSAIDLAKSIIDAASLASNEVDEIDDSTGVDHHEADQRGSRDGDKEEDQ